MTRALRPPPLCAAISSAQRACRFSSIFIRYVPQHAVTDPVHRGRCIVQELVKTGSCPVCRKMILLRLNVEA